MSKKKVLLRGVFINRDTNGEGVLKVGTTLIRVSTVMGILYSELSDQLPAELFFLPHKSYAVNLSYVTRIDTSLKCFVMTDDTNIPIKRELSGKAKKALERYYFDHTRGLK